MMQNLFLATLLSFIFLQEDWKLEVKKLRRDGYEERAKNILREYLSRKKRDIQAKEEYVKICIALDEYDQAKEMLEELSAYDSTAYIIYDMQIALAQGNFDRASVFANKILQEKGRDLEAEMCLAQIQEEYKEWDAAYEIYKKSGTLYGTEDLFFQKFIFFLLRRNYLQEVKTKLEEYGKYHKESGRHSFLYSQYYQAKGDIGKAIESMRDALYYQPGNHFYRRRLAELNVLLGRYDLMMQYLEGKNVVSQAQMESKFELAGYAYLSVSNKDGWKIFDKNYLQKKIKVPLTISMERREHDDRIRWFAEYISLANDSVEDAWRKSLSVYNLKLADSLLNQGRVMQSIFYYQRCARLDPKSEDAFQGLAQAQEMWKKELSAYKSWKSLQALKTEQDISLDTKIEQLQRKFQKNKPYIKYDIEEKSLQIGRTKLTIFIPTIQEVGRTVPVGVSVMAAECLQDVLQSEWGREMVSISIVSDPQNKLLKMKELKQWDRAIQFEAIGRSRGRLFIQLVLLGGMGEVLEKETFSRNQEDMVWTKLLWDISIWLRSKIVWKGRVIRVLSDQDKVVVTLGKEFAAGKKFYYFKEIENGKEQKNGILEVLESDEYVSVCKIKKLLSNPSEGDWIKILQD